MNFCVLNFSVQIFSWTGIVFRMGLYFMVWDHPQKNRILIIKNYRFYIIILLYIYIAVSSDHVSILTMKIAQSMTPTCIMHNS